jgi:cell division protein FtsN
MKTFIVACAAAIIVAVIGGIVLNSMNEPVEKAFSASSVRLGA